MSAILQRSLQRFFWYFSVRCKSISLYTWWTVHYTGTRRLNTSLMSFNCAVHLVVGCRDRFLSLFSSDLRHFSWSGIFRSGSTRFSTENEIFFRPTAHWFQTNEPLLFRLVWYGQVEASSSHWLVRPEGQIKDRRRASLWYCFSPPSYVTLTMD